MPSGSVYIETYGCRMNFSDSEIVASIMKENGFSITNNFQDANLILINTCAIRDQAEQRVRNRLKALNTVKFKKPETVIGIFGCMAERLKTKLIEEEQLVDLVAGPDSYRDLPNLIEKISDGKKGVNVILSKEETYGDINPVRLVSNGVSAFISIMRGCDNMCSFCVVPFTRGRERSRDPQSIISEATNLFERGFREVTLLGQNVDSYFWYGGGLKKDFNSAKELSDCVNFARLLERVAKINPDLRVRFSTSHPKDMTDEVLHTMAIYENICKSIHLPAQSGSTKILEKMNRGYTREWYMNRIKAIRTVIPDCGISADIITGFCSESEEDHKDTLSLMEWVKYDFCYMFKYSERPGTFAAKKFSDNVSETVKSKRLTEIIESQRKHSHIQNKKKIGLIQKVLVEGVSKRSELHLFGRNTQNTVVIFPRENYAPGQYADIKITDCTSATLFGTAVSDKKGCDWTNETKVTICN